MGEVGRRTGEGAKKAWHTNSPPPRRSRRALILKALDIAIEHIEPKYEDPVTAWVNKQENASAETPTVKSKPVARADALSVMAESFLAHGAAALNGGDKHQIVVHVSADHLTTSRSRDLTCCELEDGPAIASATARRLSCDCSVIHITEDEGGNPLDVGRKTRSIPPALRRALNSRDKGCRFPGCYNTNCTNGHHVEHWANGGETKLSNLVTLCRFHHHLVHEGGVHIQILDGGASRFLKANGESFESKRSNSCPSPITLHSSLFTSRAMARGSYGLPSCGAGVDSER